MNTLIFLLAVLCLLLLVYLFTNDNETRVSVRDENMACEENEITCRKKNGHGYQCCPQETPVCCEEEGCCPKDYTCCANGKACCPAEAPICCFGFENENPEEPTWLCVDSEETCRDKKIKH